MNKLSSVKILKPIHEVEFYKKYAKRASAELITKENINNMIEHGLDPTTVETVKLFITKGEDEKGKFVIFFNETPDSKNITFNDIIKHMTTFNKEEHSDRENYAKEHEHHGFTYNLRFPIILKTGNIEIKTINHVDCPEYFFWYDEQDVNLAASFTNGWSVKIYSDEIYNKVEEVLDWYVFPTDTNIDVILDGKSFPIKKQDITTYDKYRLSFWDSSYTDRILYHDLKFDETGKGKINGYWKLSNGIWQLIHLPDFNPNVSGNIYINDNEILADESRGELIKSAETKIIKAIDKIVNEHRSEIEKSNRLLRFDEYVDNFRLVMKSFLGIPYQVIDEILKNQESREDKLELISSIWETILDVYRSLGIASDVPIYNKFNQNAHCLNNYELMEYLKGYLKLNKIIPSKCKFGLLYQEGELVGECTIQDINKNTAIKIASLANIDDEDLKSNQYIEPIATVDSSSLELIFYDRVIYDLDDLTVREDLGNEIELEGSVDDLNIGYNKDEYDFVNIEEFDENYPPKQVGYYMTQFSKSDHRNYLCMVIDGRNNQTVPYLYKSSNTYRREQYKFVNYNIYMAFTKGVATLMRYYKINKPVITAITSEEDHEIEYYMKENLLIINSRLFSANKDGRKLVNVNLMLYKICEALTIMQYPQFSRHFQEKFMKILQESSKKLEYNGETFYLSDKLKQYF